MLDATPPIRKCSSRKWQASMMLGYTLRVEKSLQSIYRSKDFARVCSFVRLFRWQDIQNGTKMRSGSNTKLTSCTGDARRRRRRRRLCLIKRISLQRRNSVEFAIERSIRTRMSAERSSDNRESSAKELIQIGKLLKLIPRGCWQTFLSLSSGYIALDQSTTRLKEVRLENKSKNCYCLRIL